LGLGLSEGLGVSFGADVRLLLEQQLSSWDRIGLAPESEKGLQRMNGLFDVSLKTDAAFPRHGWVESTSGARLLRLPVMRLYQFGEPTFDAYAANGLGGMWLQCRSPYMSLRQLAIALRELHAEVTVLTPTLDQEWMQRPPSQERDAAGTRYQEGAERVEVLLIAVFVLLRRLADQLIDASRPVLFEKWQSAPRALKTAISMAQSDSLSALGPRVSLGLLNEALLHRTGWFEQLRKDEGIRDILVHKDHILLVSGQGSRAPTDSKTNWRVSAQLTRRRGSEVVTIELFDVLRECLRGACDFMEQLCLSVGMVSGYKRGDWLFLTGVDSDTVGFWPQACHGASSDA
jgi:hypothetical protein